MQAKSKILEEIKSQAKEFFHNSHGSHDWDHSIRVTTLAVNLATPEKADPFVVELAALLHDIGRKTQDNSRGKICHAEAGAKLAENILRPYRLKQADNILHAIISHRFRNAHAPKTIEAKVLYDADKLDSIGAVGIGRAFLFAGEIGAKLHNPNVNISQTEPYTIEDTAYREFLVKLQYVKDRMLTKSGRKIAVERHNFMVSFFQRMNQEIDGIL